MKELKMHLLPQPFSLIEEGKKTVEVRLFDEKRRTIEVGDRILFECEGKRLNATVVALHRAPSFLELLSEKSLREKAGWQTGTDPAEAAAQMRGIYSEEEERTCGALGIELKIEKRS